HSSNVTPSRPERPKRAVASRYLFHTVSARSGWRIVLSSSTVLTLWKPALTTNSWRKKVPMPSSTASRQRRIAHELLKSVLCRDVCSYCARGGTAALSCGQEFQTHRKCCARRS